MAAKNPSRNGLEANCFTDPSNAATPEWAVELLRIRGVGKVTALESGRVAVDTEFHWSDTGHAEAEPELLPELDGLEDWGIAQVKLHKDGLLRFELRSKTTSCDAEDCHMPATGEIEDVRLDGTAFTINTCDDH